MGTHGGMLGVQGVQKAGWEFLSEKPSDSGSPLAMHRSSWVTISPGPGASGGLGWAGLLLSDRPGND